MGQIRPVESDSRLHTERPSSDPRLTSSSRCPSNSGSSAPPPPPKQSVPRPPPRSEEPLADTQPDLSFAPLRERRQERFSARSTFSKARRKPSASPRPGAARMRALSRKRPRPGPAQARYSGAALAPLPAVRGGHWLRAAPPRASGGAAGGATRGSGPCGAGRAGPESPGPWAARVRAAPSPLTAGPARRVAEERRYEEEERDDDDDEAERSLRTAFKRLRLDEARRWIAAQPAGDGTVLTAPRRRDADGAPQPSVCQEARNGCERTSGGSAGLSRQRRSRSPVLSMCGTASSSSPAFYSEEAHTYVDDTSVEDLTGYLEHYLFQRKCLPWLK
ncbi:translation initiation factor IF-2-like [Lagopus muta]|uniref:translation initiation factor IF-2-like n=1 Tax=Lagopus muta TaxID=64668 RepID=UPI00209CA375|nr:translation initiation factor IF-2-like [Lagopus muta]